MTAPRSLTEAWSLDLAPATTDAPFITLLRGALLPAANFNTWLYNDYIYVHAHTHLLAHLIAALPAASHLHPLLTGGYTALHSELSLFRSKASSRGVSLLDLPAPHQDPTAEAGRSPAHVLAALAPAAAEGCRRYMAFLMSLCMGGTTHWTGLLAVLWICERVYLDAMVSVRGGGAFADGHLDEGIRGFVEWWSSSEFVDYVETLEREAAGVRGGEGWREEETKAHVVKVVELEVGFWGIAMEGL